MNPRNAVCFLAVLLIASVPLAFAQGTYTQIDVPGASYAELHGINMAGDVIGSYCCAGGIWHGFLLSRGIYTTIDYPGGVANTFLYGINDLGQIVGFAGPSPDFGFLYDVATQTFTTISLPHAGLTVPYAINNAGTIAGVATRSDGQNYGFELLGSRYRKIAPLGATDSNVDGISASGELVGNFTAVHPSNFLFRHGEYREFAIPDAPKAIVRGVNSSGTSLVGVYEPVPGISAGFLFQNKTSQTLQFPGSNQTFANGINDAGEVVGWIYDSNNLEHGFTWTPPADATKKSSNSR